MAYTETTSTSFFSRLGNSFSGIGMGIALVIAGTVLLWRPALKLWHLWAGLCST